MALSRQGESRTIAAPRQDRRANQKARTRAALLQAAIGLVREGRPPSMPEAADRALISVATAYRYFSSAEDLWWEASTAAVDLDPALAAIDQRIVAAGDDPLDRLEAAIRGIDFLMMEDQVPFRRLAKLALEQWFANAENPEDEAAPVREGRRREVIDLVLEPLVGQVPAADLRRIRGALGTVIGTDAVIAVLDGMGLEERAARQALLDAGRWMLTGALAELSSRTTS